MVEVLPVLTLFIVVILWMAGSDSSMNYYQRDVQRAARRQSRREQASLRRRRRPGRLSNRLDLPPRPSEPSATRSPLEKEAN